MKILVDADACPVRQIIESIAAEFQIPVLMIIDTSHLLTSDYSEIITVSKAPDAVDFALINRTKKGDIVVTQDYGVAAMALGKKAFAIHQNGMIYTNDIIDSLMLQRHIANKQRRLRIHICSTKKRSAKHNEKFAHSFRKLCILALQSEKNQ